MVEAAAGTAADQRPTTTLASRAWGRVVGLRLPSAEVTAARAWLPWWWMAEGAAPERVWDAPSAAACEVVVRHLELWVAEHAVDRIFVHAGVVYDDGRALVLPGRSWSGKSTLVSALVAQGARYGSDEYAVLDAGGLVHPYPRPITTREADGSRTRGPVPHHLVGEPAPIALVARVHHDPGTPGELVDVGPGEAALHLLDNTVAAQTRPEEALAHIAAALVGSRAVAGPRGEASLTAAELLARLRVT